MASTKKVNIKIGADGKEAQGAIEKTTQALNKLGKSKTASSLAKLGSAVTGVKAAFDMATKAIGAANAAIKETTELYKKQEKAEVQLEVAAKNNPYLDGVAVKQLKDYAGELQKISTVGDEELLPMMARLASAGRTQNEIQQIMSAALDVSASGMMSLDSAVTALNKTYSGSVGLIGNQISGLKGLTAEQLKNGEAVKIVADKFKGMSAETAKATGTSEQLKNAWGDLKETFGKPFERAMSPMRSFFTELVSGWASARKARQDYNDARKAADNGTAGLEEYQVLLEKAQAEQEKKLKAAQKRWGREVSGDELTEHYEKRKDSADIKGGIFFAAADYVNATKEVEKYTEVIRKLKKEEQDRIQAEKDAEAAREAKLKEREEAEKAALAAAEEKRKAEEDYAKAKGDLQGKIERLTYDEIEALEAEKEAIQEAWNALTDEDKEKIGKTKFDQALDEIDAKIEEIRNKGVETTVEQTQNALTTIKTIADEIVGMFGTIKDAIEDNAKSEMATLDEQLAHGIISQEQYEKKKAEIEKKAALETYKINLAMWAAQLLQGAANVALGVTQALSSSPPPVNFVMAGITAAAGAVEIGTLIANKPKRPQFAQGGIVQGNSYSGDKVIANVNSGEMILNTRQQRQLWEAANGSGMMGGVQVNISNSAANLVRATPQIDGNTINLMIDARVSESLRKGRYDAALDISEANRGGTFYGV